MRDLESAARRRIAPKAAPKSTGKRNSDFFNPKAKLDPSQVIDLRPGHKQNWLSYYRDMSPRRQKYEDFDTNVLKRRIPNRP